MNKYISAIAQKFLAGNTDTDKPDGEIFGVIPATEPMGEDEVAQALRDQAGDNSLGIRVVGWNDPQTPPLLARKL